MTLFQRFMVWVTNSTYKMYNSILTKIFILIFGFNILLISFLIATEDTAEVEINQRKELLNERSHLISEIIRPILENLSQEDDSKGLKILRRLQPLPLAIHKNLIIRPYKTGRLVELPTPLFDGSEPNLISEIMVVSLLEDHLTEAFDKSIKSDILDMVFWFGKIFFDQKILTKKIEVERTRTDPLEHVIPYGKDMYEIRLIVPFKISGETVATIDLIDHYNLKESYLERNSWRLFVLFTISGLTIIFGLILAFSIALPLRRLSKKLNRSISKKSVSEDLFNFKVRGLEGRGDEVGLLYKNLLILNDKLANLFSDKEAFAADISHELKNPLASIIANLENIPPTSDLSTRNALDTIAKQADRMNRLISEISDSPLVDAELVQAKWDRFDLSVLINDIVTNMTKNADAVHVVLDTKINPRIKFLGLSDRIAQVAVNLIENAITFSPVRSKVNIILKKSFRNVIELIIEDSGPGVPSTELEKVFERFYTNRVGKSFKKNSSGLGLYICKQIVEAHNGSIRIEKSEKLSGARFIVRFKV